MVLIYFKHTLSTKTKTKYSPKALLECERLSNETEMVLFGPFGLVCVPASNLGHLTTYCKPFVINLGDIFDSAPKFEKQTRFGANGTYSVILPSQPCHLVNLICTPHILSNL